GPILDMISGEIDESMLGEDLKNKIDGLQDQIDALDGLKAYDKNEPYEEGQMVVVDGRIYQAVHDVPADPSGANAPPNVAFWIDVGQSIETANGLAQKVQTNTTKIEEVDGKVASTAESVQVLRASARDDDPDGDLAGALKLWDSTAAIAREQIVRATETDVLARSSETLEAKVGETNAAVQTVSQAQANFEGKASTMWSVKMQLNAQGQYVAAGIGLGIENGPAGLQSQFLVSADRFAVVNNINGTLTSPFTVQGGQVLINTALINTAFIQQIVAGMSIVSESKDSQGRPLLEMNFKTGAVTFRGQDANGSTLITNGQVNTNWANGNPATKMG
ncbi:DUF1983 domain-containing protein, partial [Pseudomonas mosselii]